MRGIIAEKIHEAGELKKMIVQFRGILENFIIEDKNDFNEGLKAALNLYKGFFGKELGLKP